MFIIFQYIFFYFAWKKLIILIAFALSNWTTSGLYSLTFNYVAKNNSFVTWLLSTNIAIYIAWTTSCAYTGCLMSHIFLQVDHWAWGTQQTTACLAQALYKHIDIQAFTDGEIIIERIFKSSLQYDQNTWNQMILSTIDNYDIFFYY